jgi:hypothetical protein
MVHVLERIVLSIFVGKRYCKAPHSLTHGAAVLCDSRKDIACSSDHNRQPYPPLSLIPSTPPGHSFPLSPNLCSVLPPTEDSAPRREGSAGRRWRARGGGVTSGELRRPLPASARRRRHVGRAPPSAAGEHEEAAPCQESTAVQCRRARGGGVLQEGLRRLQPASARWRRHVGGSPPATAGEREEAAPRMEGYARPPPASARRRRHAGRARNLAELEEEARRRMGSADDDELEKEDPNARRRRDIGRAPPSPLRRGEEDASVPRAGAPQSTAQRVSCHRRARSVKSTAAVVSRKRLSPSILRRLLPFSSRRSSTASTWSCHGGAAADAGASTATPARMLGGPHLRSCRTTFAAIR